ncbi:MAG: DUF2085 domain-containing protein [Clostridium sp.]|nr:DUF2085 domain-containing protein [Clostridium sp.]
MTKILYKWLPIIFGCHCRKDRSFHYKEIKFPICARCTGELIGMLLCGFSYIFFQPKLYIIFFLMIPMLIDGFVQAFTSYESNNIRRVITGILFGYAFLYLIISSTVFTYQLGKIFKAKYLTSII